MARRPHRTAALLVAAILLACPATSGCFRVLIASAAVAHRPGTLAGNQEPRPSTARQGRAQRRGSRSSGQARTALPAGSSRCRRRRA
jgi:hypothetical protein